MTTDEPLFTPPCGTVRGRRDRAVVRATGIRYATAERFARPRPADDWTTTYDATRAAPVCPQPESALITEVLGPQDDRVQDEHCQYLSVTVPDGRAPDERLPVMVWIHGGSYTTGAPDLAIMDPARLVEEQRVVVVEIGYRLGLFGYLGSSDDRPANLGLLDQLEAFRWVRRNIGSFGGDPDRVTAFGQSAGGDAVLHLMALDEARGLFSRAIVQSPPLGITRGRRAMSTAMAVAAERITVDTPAEEVLAVQAEAEEAAARFGLLGGMPFGVQYGFAPLPDEDDIEATWDRTAQDVEVLIGHTTEETRMFLGSLPRIQGLLRVPVVGSLLGRALVRVTTAQVYVKGIRQFARRHAAAGGRATEYVIGWDADRSSFGAAHTIDLPLLFGDEDAWRRAALVDHATWASIDAAGLPVRRLWADFARGATLPEKGGVPGVLTYRRVAG